MTRCSPPPQTVATWQPVPTASARGRGGGPASQGLKDSVEVPIPAGPSKLGLLFCNRQFSLMNQVALADLQKGNHPNAALELDFSSRSSHGKAILRD